MKHTIAIIGAGAVGSATAYALAMRDIAAAILLIDADEEKESGEVMDIGDALSHTETSSIRGADFSDAKDADIIIVTAGAAQKPGETRLDLVKKNTAIMKEIFGAIGQMRDDAIVIMITNPVDIMTQLVQELTGLPHSQVFGSGTTLDTARLKHALGETLGVSPQNIHGYVLGEHGDSEFVAWSTVEVGGIPIRKIKSMTKDRLSEIEEQVRGSAYEIIHRKGMTNYGIGATVVNIVEAITHDQHLILPVSTRLTGWNGISGVCLGAPAVIGEGGVERLWPLVLPWAEKKKLRRSAGVVRKYLTHA